ncbi:MAG: MarR family transcriptional regulator [Oscillospiraceae bacterium]|nr:MarR family transcriptional regulator [Oscillospiraceae bacterium]
MLHFDKEVFPLNPIYGHSIRVLHWVADQTMSATLASMDLTASQGHILAFIAHSPQPPCPRDMEEAFQLSHPTVSGLLRRLEKKGFIRCAPDPADRRCKRVFLDAKGKECLARMDATIAGNERRMVENFTEEEKRQFADLLDRAIINMGGCSCRCAMKNPEKEESD